MINCAFYNKNKNPICLLNYHGGFPSNDTCIDCIKSELNNEKSAKTLFEKYEKSHPAGVDRISGCCDSARNYID
jgi:hypothetical protein